MLNELFKDKLRVVANDSLLLEVLKTVFNEIAERQKPIIGNDTNELLGEKYRAYELAKAFIREAFNEIINYKEFPKTDIKFNKER